MTYQVTIDFETASTCDLKKCGAWKYAEDLNTEILCISYSIDGARPKTLGAYDLAGDNELRHLAADVFVDFVAHNVMFEKAIWRTIMMRDYGYPDIPDTRWVDTQAICAMKALPLGLDAVAAVIKLAHQKDREGSKLTIGLSKPNKDGYFDRSPATLARVYRYCESDVEAEVELHKRIGSLQASERPIWLHDQLINQRGLRIDLPYVDACQKIVDEASVPLVTEFVGITGVKPSQGKKVLEWIREEGVAIENLRKETIADLLGDDEDADDQDANYEEDEDSDLPDMPPHVRRALEIRSTIGSASIKKLRAIRNAVMADGRVRGLLQYHGAGPGRWTGRLFQPHNFPRGNLKIDYTPPPADLVAATLLTGDANYVEAILGEPINAVVSGLRHALIPSQGHRYVAGDYSQIEARLVLALAGQHDKCALMAAGQDFYIDMAQSIFRRPIDKKKDPAERTIGKFTVLGSGFQMGWKTFKLRYAKDRDDEFCKRCINAYREDFAPEVPKLWAALEEASVRAVWDKKTTEAYGVTYSWEDIWLTARLPSGRKIYYTNPKPARKAMPWDKTDIRPAWTCEAWKMGRWVTRDMYGGLDTQNVVEGLARDIMCHGMKLCEQNGIPIVLTVHDEIIGEPLAEKADHVMLGQIMRDRPEWAVKMGVPVASEGWVGDRYKK